MIKKTFGFKHNKFYPSVNEWPNSVYNFDKNKLNTLFINTLTYNIINKYFNIKPLNFLLFRNTKHTLNKIFVGIPEIKNSINKINICIYVFNKEMIIIKKKINKLKKIKNKINSEKFKDLTLRKSILEKTYKNIFKFNIFKLNGLNILKTMKIIGYSFIIKKKDFLLKRYLIKFDYSLKQINLKKIRNNMKSSYKIYLYKRYITKMYFNRSKFNYINLINLSKILYKVFNKNIKINIINLKYLHLDNSILIQTILRKLKDRNRKILKVIRKALTLVKIPEITYMFLLHKTKASKQIIKNIYNIVDYKYKDLNNIKDIIFESLKNIHIIGTRIEGKGRLTRRLTASRAVYKKSYIGSLKNIYSSEIGLSTLMTKGFNKSNINYVNSNSYNRLGSYGIKIWQNTM